MDRCGDLGFMVAFQGRSFPPYGSIFRIRASMRAVALSCQFALALAPLILMIRVHLGLEFFGGPVGFVVIS